MTDRIQAWHFVGATLRDGRPIPADGETLTHDGPIALCRAGLHASVRIIDALQYAPGNTLCRVECWGDVQHESDKLVARNRVITWRINAEPVLQQFARQCALDVAHLWGMPAVVRQYLETGDETIRAAARAAARNAAMAAARDAARAAARAAAMAAAMDAARAAERAAAMDAAMAAARDAARAAARAAAMDAAMDAQNTRLEQMVMQAKDAA